MIQQFKMMALHYSAFNLEAFFLIAERSEHTDLNLWNYTSPQGKSLRKGFDVLKPYLSNQKQWEGLQIRNFDFEEDAYPLLIIAASKLHCSDCKDAIQKLPGKKEAQLRLDLLY
jgi:hypothetical protein